MLQSSIPTEKRTIPFLKVSFISLTLFITELFDCSQPEVLKNFILKFLHLVTLKTKSKNSILTTDSEGTL